MVCQTLDATCERVQLELTLVGLQVHVHQGDQETVTSEMHAPWQAIVLVHDDGRQQIWARHGERASAAEPVEVQPVHGESRDSVALRSAELVRAELLPQNTPSSSVSSEPASALPLGPRPAWTVTTGPSLLGSTYGGAVIGWTADMSYWWERMSLGLTSTGALFPTAWAPAAKEMNQQQLSYGILAKGLLLRTLAERFDLILAGGAGARTQWLSSRPKPTPMNEERYRGIAMALVVYVQLEASYSFFPWLAVGGGLGGTLGVPLSFPEPSDTLMKKASDALTQADQQKHPDGLMQGSVLVTFRF